MSEMEAKEKDNVMSLFYYAKKTKYLFCFRVILILIKQNKQYILYQHGDPGMRLRISENVGKFTYNPSKKIAYYHNIHTRTIDHWKLPSNVKNVRLNTIIDDIAYLFIDEGSAENYLYWVTIGSRVYRSNMGKMNPTVDPVGILNQNILAAGMIFPGNFLLRTNQERCH